MKKILVILGPTATGKSDLAVYLAKKFNGEVVSADSRQVYKGLDIATGKITKREMKGVRHHLLDVVSPKRTFSVAQYQMLAYRVIDDILSRGKLPIVCGGTGFYIQSIVDGICLPEVPPNDKLRQVLAKKDKLVLQKFLLKLDPHRFAEVDLNNRARLVRAIEIAKHLGKVPDVKRRPKYLALQIGLSPAPTILKRRITERIKKRLKQGMVAEAKKLHKDGLSYRRMRELGLEYRYLAGLLQNKIDRKELAEKIYLEDWHYVKRQLTWFKKDRRINWFPSKTNSRILKLVREFLAA